MVQVPSSSPREDTNGAGDTGLLRAWRACGCINQLWQKFLHIQGLGKWGSLGHYFRGCSQMQGPHYFSLLPLQRANMQGGSPWTVVTWKGSFLLVGELGT